MPDDRFLHPRLRMSTKVSMLSDFEYRVWTDYLLVADNFGVLPYSGAMLRAGNIALATRPEGLVMAALDGIVKVGLLLEFEHQGQRYVCDPVWQDFQKIRYPRPTYYPAPPPKIFGKLSEKTQKLFRNFSEKFPHLTRPGYRLTANGLRLKAQEEGSGEEGSGEEGSGEKPGRVVVVTGFDLFWATWPKERRKEKAKAAAEWRRLRPEPDLECRIVAAVETQKTWPDWRKDGGRFIPYPHRWLKGRRWEDEGPRAGQPATQDVFLAGLDKFVRGGTA